MNYSDVYNENLFITEDSKINGVVQGNVFVNANLTVKVNGVVNGTVYLLDGCKLKINGAVNGAIKKETEFVKIKSNGIHNGVTQLLTAHEVETVKSQLAEAIANPKPVSEPKYSFSNSSISIGGNVIGSCNISTGAGKTGNGVSISTNTMIVGNKKVVISSNRGLSIQQINGKTYVNNIDIDTLEPDEDGVYHI